MAKIAGGPGTIALAFRRRLELGLLNTRDRETLELARRVRKAVSENVPMGEIAHDVNMKEDSLRAWLRRGMAKQAFAYLEQEDSQDDELIAERKRKGERIRLEAQGENSIAFIEDCFRYQLTREGRQWKSPPLAQWATEKMMKFKGWDQNTKAQRPIIQVGELTIINQMSGVAADDAKLKARAIQAEVIVEPIALPAPEPPS